MEWHDNSFGRSDGRHYAIRRRNANSKMKVSFIVGCRCSINGMLSGKVFGIGKGRVWAVVALLLVQGMFAGCLKRAEVIERAAPSSNQSPGFLVERQEGKWRLISTSRERFLSMV